MAFSTESEARPYILGRQVWKVGQHFVRGHATGQILQHVLDVNPHPAYARLPATLARLNRDQLRVIQNEIVRGKTAWAIAD